MSVIETSNLSKLYRPLRGSEVTAVNNLSLSITEPGVYGFLGPNGSGKTTTIRCLLGLIRPTSGRISLLGKDVTNNLSPVVNQVGALVETPKFFPNFTARKNLKLLASVAGVPDANLDWALDIVGLNERKNDRFHTFSLGMKQRLAIAATLLKDPQLIILDEPANGLDPEGIVEIRKLIRGLGDRGKTVFVSSHQLAEVQQACDHVSIVAKGQLVTSGSMAELVERAGPSKLIVTITDTAKATEVLTNSQIAASPGTETNTLVVESNEPEKINKLLADQGLYLSALTQQKASLEETFLELTAGMGQQ